MKEKNELEKEELEKVEGGAVWIGKANGAIYSENWSKDREKNSATNPISGAGIGGKDSYNAGPQIIVGGNNEEENK